MRVNHDVYVSMKTLPASLRSSCDRGVGLAPAATTPDRIKHASPLLRFGACELVPHRRELRVNGSAVHLGGRAFDLLMVLVEGRGRLVTKDEILGRVWSGLIVEENTLQVQMSALRKALGADRHAQHDLRPRLPVHR